MTTKSTTKRAVTGTNKAKRTFPLLNNGEGTTATKTTKNSNKNKNNNEHKVKKKERTLKKAKRSHEFSRYIYKTLKQVHPNFTISAKGMVVMNDFITDMFHKLALEAKKMRKVRCSKTILPKEIESACKVALPGDLAYWSAKAGTKAMFDFQAWPEVSPSPDSSEEVDGKTSRIVNATKKTATSSNAETKNNDEEDVDMTDKEVDINMKEMDNDASADEEKEEEAVVEGKDEDGNKDSMNEDNDDDVDENNEGVVDDDVEAKKKKDSTETMLPTNFRAVSGSAKKNLRNDLRKSKSPKDKKRGQGKKKVALGKKNSGENDKSKNNA